MCSDKIRLASNLDKPKFELRQRLTIVQNIAMKFPAWLFCLLICAVFIASPAHAQEAETDEGMQFVEPTAEQAELNDRAVRALSNGDHVKAISLLEEANYLGELNITYLNLGRAQQLAGRCDKARQALAVVPNAPKVEKPPPGLIEAKAEEFLAELEETCASKSATQSQVPSEDPGGTQAMKLEPDSTSTPTGGGSNTLGVVAISTGVAMMAGAASMHFLWAQKIRRDSTAGLSQDEPVTDLSQRAFYDNRDRANAIDTASLAVGITGGVLTGMGLYLWLSDSGTESAGRVGLSPTSEGVRATWTLQF